MADSDSTQSLAAFFSFPEGVAEPSAPALSVVAPMFNEEGGAAILVDEIAAALEGVSYEIIVVDDCSADGTASALKGARQRHDRLRILTHGENAGQSRAIRTGVLAARSPVVAMIDGDGQNDPADIPAVWRALRGAGPAVAMAAGERRNRQDAAAKRWASRIANGFRRRLLQDGATDTGCGLKVFYREAFLRLPYFDHMHRYLPALMRREGFRVVFTPVSHRPRVHGESKYTNFGRFAVAIRDLIGVTWLLARSRSPKSIAEEAISEVRPDVDCDKVK